MKQIKLPITSLLVLVSALVLAAGTPVFAHNGEHHSGDDTSSSSGGSGRTVQATEAAKTSDDTGPEVEAGHTSEVEVHHSNTSELKQKGQDDLSQRKQKGKSQSDDQRKKVCEARKQGLNTRADHIVSNSKRIQARIDGILQKATDYKTNKNLNPADWDNLLTAAQSAQSASSSSITTLESVKPTVDCNNVAVASDVATFKAAATETRNNLKAYRDSVKAVLKSLAEVKTGTDSTGGSN